MSRSDRFFETLKKSTRPGEKSRPRLFGILNLTPDSFSDGGAHNASAEVAADFAAQMVADGADALDLGAESTRPGSEEVPADEEIRRLLPALKLNIPPPSPWKSSSAFSWKGWDGRVR